MLRLFLLFTVLPVAELALLIHVGGVLGGWPTVGLCLLTGFVGAALARSQGAGVVRRMQATVQRGQLPARELVDAALIVVAGVVLLTPGFITDAMGLLLLLPPTRALVRGALMRRFRDGVASGAWTVRGRWAGEGPGAGEASQRPRGPWVNPSADAILYPPESAPPTPRRPPPRIIDVED